MTINLETRPAKVGVAALAASFIAMAPALSDTDYPTQTVRLVVPFAAGGGTDILARQVAQGLTERLGQTVIVDNRPGAGSLIGVTHAIGSEPDGYTLIMISSSYVTNIALGEDEHYDPRSALQPVTAVSFAPTLLVVNPDTVEAETLEDFVAAARANPGFYTYGTFGARSQPHLSSVMLASEAEIEIEGIPYGGGGPAVTAVVSGEVDLLLPSAMLVKPQVDAGQLRPLALASATRSPLLPDVPTFTEAMFPFEMGTWFGVAAPVGTDPAIIARINTAMQDFLASDEARAQIEESGAQVIPYDPEAFQQFINDQMDQWTRVREQGLFD